MDNTTVVFNGQWVYISRLIMALLIRLRLELIFAYCDGSFSWLKW